MKPETSTIKSLALKYLGPELPGTLNLDRIDVQFFDQGSFNKLYSISCFGCSKTYLLRVALPLVPYYKVESEAAVLSYIKENTSIPVARVIAWDSSAANDLGFEWILLEMIDGVAVYDIWRKITWASKLKIVAALAPILEQLREHHFNRIGSLYFKGRERQPDPQYESKNDDNPRHASKSDYARGSDQYGRQAGEVKFAESAANTAQEQNAPPEIGIRNLSITATNDGHDSQPAGFARKVEDATTGGGAEHTQYVIGPLISPLFYLCRRLYLPGNRGPYRSSREWMAAEIDFQRTWAKTEPLIKTMSNREDFDRYDWDSDCDEEALEMERLSDEYQDVLPEIFPSDEGDSSCVIHHHDLSLANILVNPDTYEIIGIIDWEMIQVVPEWKSSRFPKFLTKLDTEEIDDKEPRRPTAAEYDENGESYNALAVESRDRWEFGILRQHFDKCLNRTRGEVHFSSHMSDIDRAKREFKASITDITETIDSARWWLEKYLWRKRVALENE